MRNPTTIDYYDQHAASFVENTCGVSMANALSRFVATLPAGGRVLDWGCGSGRDSKALRELGFQVTSTDGSSIMCEEALRATGTVVRCERFEDLREVATYDGIWACSSLLHVKPNDLPAVFDRASFALKPAGILYCSFKYGSFTGYRSGRWFTDLDEPALTALLEPRFTVTDLWLSGDVREGRGDELWLNCLATKR